MYSLLPITSKPLNILLMMDILAFFSFNYYEPRNNKGY